MAFVTETEEGEFEQEVEATPTLRELLSSRSVKLIIASRFFSSGSSVAVAVAAGKIVFDITDRELDLGFIGLAEFLPTALLVLLAGSLADRYDRRRIAFVALLAEGIVAAGLAWYVSTDPTAVWPIFLLVGLIGTARGFANPASRALPPLVAPPGGLPRLISTTSATWQMAAVAGPVMAGMVFVIDPALPFVVIAISLVLSGILLLLVKYETEQEMTTERPTLSSALEGLRLVRRTPILLAAIGLDLAAVLFGGAVALAPALAEDRLGVGAIGLGWLRGASGIGAGLMAIALTVAPVSRYVGRRLLYAVFAFGVFTVMLGFTQSFAVAMLLLCAIAAADMLSVYVRATIVPLATPDHLRGRVMAVEAVFIGASNELGAFESGVTAELFGLVPAIVLGGAATIVIVILWWFLFPSMRKLDRFDEIDITTRRGV